MSDEPSDSGDSAAVAVLVAVLIGAGVVFRSLLESGTLSPWAVVAGFLLGWLFVYATWVGPLAAARTRLRESGNAVVLSAAVVLACVTYVLTSAVSLESGVLTSGSFGLLLGVAAVLLVGP